MDGFAAVIFDMDGVLVDGEPLHFRAVNQLLGEEGLSISLEAYKPYMGTKAGWSDMMRDMGLSKPESYYVPRYHEIILEQYRTRSVPEPGAVELVRGLRAAGARIAVASSSRTPWVEACLEAIGLGGAFEALITGSDIEHGKPAPDIYLLAAERLSVDPTRCLAIEDAPAGIFSAKAAGMTVWAVRTEYTRGLELPRPHREFERIADIGVDNVLGVAV
ncbi:MAG: HAD family phosphatase [Dehalococcoidia bacterium]|nr:HAD family phosphatase [Dehalococcoidia bacterium]